LLGAGPGGAVTETTLALERSRAVVFRNLFREQSELLKVGRYELVRTLGRGGMGVVYEALNPSQRERVALKMMHGRSPTDLSRLKREFRSLAGISHPNLVTMHELCVSQQHAFFTMELVCGEDIVSYVRRGAPRGGASFQERRLRSALVQLCEALRWLHAAGKLHCDLKPANVLVTEAGRVVLLDFGLAQDAHAEQLEIAGTFPYTAPEQYRGRACPSSDRYSFGCILHEALHARPPAIGRCERPTPLPRLARLASDLLGPDPAARPEWDEILSVLSDRA
jgi:serine/threonine protein kinase